MSLVRGGFQKIGTQPVLFEVHYKSLDAIRVTLSEKRQGTLYCRDFIETPQVSLKRSSSREFCKEHRAKHQRQFKRWRDPIKHWLRTYEGHGLGVGSTEAIMLLLVIVHIKSPRRYQHDKSEPIRTTSVLNKKN